MNEEMASLFKEIELQDVIDVDDQSAAASADRARLFPAAAAFPGEARPIRTAPPRTHRRFFFRAQIREGERECDPFDGRSSFVCRRADDQSAAASADRATTSSGGGAPG